MSINGIDIIYWINLDRSVERKNNMEQILTDDCFNGVEKKRFSAVDGKEPNNIDSKINVTKKSITDLEYGCLLSHLEVIREFSKSDYEIALILEDDLTLDFKKYWDKDLQEVINNAPKNWEAIMLSYISNELPNEEYTFNENKYWSTLAYVINKKGANKLINNMYYDNKYVIDPNINNEADQYIFQKINTYVYKYPFFIYKYGEESTLHQGAITRHDISRKRIEKMYNNEFSYIEGFSKYTIPFYTFIKKYIWLLLCIFIVIIYLIMSLFLRLNKKSKKKVFTKLASEKIKLWFFSPGI